VSRCKGCGAEYRKGSIAFLLSAGGGMKGARVCQACVTGGVLLVAAKVAPAVVSKVVRTDGLVRVLRMLNAYAKAARSGIGAMGQEGIGNALLQGRAEGFEGAVEVIRRECGGGS
jgi:hypothetical protein